MQDKKLGGHSGTDGGELPERNLVWLTYRGLVAPSDKGSYFTPVLEGGVGLPGEHKQGFWGIPRQKDKTLAEQRHRMREEGGGKYWVWR